MKDNQVSTQENKFPNANSKGWEIAQWVEYYAHEHKMSIAAYSSDEKVRLGTRGKSTAPQPYEEVQRMFQVNPLLNIAMVPGENGIVVVDFDVKAAKADLGRTIEKDPAFLLLPETPSVDTPSGGMHFYFRMPYGIKLKTKLDLYKHHPLYGVAGKDKRRKVDFLSSGHAGVILPPSSFGSGEYRWVLPLGAAEIADLPLRILLIPVWEKQAIDEGEEWTKIMEKTGLIDGDYRNGFLVSFISKLYFVLLAHGNSASLSQKAAMEETRKVNAGFNEPLPDGIVEGIITRFQNYSKQKNHSEKLIERKQADSENKVNWAEALIEGVGDGENYSLRLKVLNEEVLLECTAKDMEKPDVIARACRHALRRTDFECEYEGSNNMKKLWIQEVVGTWLSLITPSSSLSTTAKVLGVLRDYCTRFISKSDTDAYFKQTQTCVRDGKQYFIPFIGFREHVQKKLDKVAADRFIANALKSIGAEQVRKGDGRATFYQLSYEQLYEKETYTSEARVREDDTSCKQDSGSVETEQDSNFNKFWEEEHSGSEGKNTDLASGSE